MTKVKFLAAYAEVNYAEIDGKLYECEVKSFTWNKNDQKGFYSLLMKDNSLHDVPSDNISFYFDKKCYENNNPYRMPEEDLEEFATDVLCRRKCGNVAYKVEDKSLKEISTSDITTFFVDYVKQKYFFDGIMEGTCCPTKNDALAMHEIEVIKKDGTKETVGGAMRCLLLNDKQRKIADKFNKVFKELCDAGVFIAKWEDSTRFINNLNLDYVDGWDKAFPSDTKVREFTDAIWDELYPVDFSYDYDTYESQLFFSLKSDKQAKN